MQHRALTFISAITIVFGSFPNSDNPITELPLLSRPTTPSYTVNIFHEAPCSSWNAILTSNYNPPSVSITGTWSKIILDMKVGIYWHFLDILL